MKIRRYYGYDCDSIMGFNNGQYIDDDPIEVKDLDEAMRLCRKALVERVDEPPSKFYEQGCFGYEVVTGYYGIDGTVLSAEEFDKLNELEECGHWTYEYVNFEYCD